MKKLTKKAFMALFALVLAVVALGTTTFAWFTTGNTVALSDIQLDIDGGEGLEFTFIDSTGANDGVWRSGITTADLLKYIAKDYGFTNESTGVDEFKAEFKFDAVTSEDGLTFKKLDTSKAGLLSDALTPYTTDSGYIQFKLRFRTKVEPAGGNHLELMWSGLTLDSPAVEWTPSVSYTNISNTTQPTTGAVTSYPHNGARVAVIDNKAAGAAEISVYEKPEQVGVNLVLSDTEPQWAKGAHNFYEKATTINLSDTFGGTNYSGTYYKAVKTFTTDPGSSNRLVANFEDHDGNWSYANITIKIYLEGFDSETFNAILGGKLTTALKFTWRETA